ncbi:hypothetical protein TERTU_1802 [Teredinibacter turnerae T7901]|uniref:Uncharacterized protein n=1 Tax=Teredinibacter turnerae (strain ATCC 39867 / T7901) TaxID=377629 RepID=C5BHS5_TERTT|nr:hypothetical protein TERTU_1802 [Teredinibacter turnerae T7901]
MWQRSVWPRKTSSETQVLLADLVMKAYAASSNYWDQTTLQHIKYSYSL